MGQKYTVEMPCSDGGSLREFETMELSLKGGSASSVDINGSSACVRNISIKTPPGIIESRTNIDFSQAFFRNCKSCVYNCDNLLYFFFL